MNQTATATAPVSTTASAAPREGRVLQRPSTAKRDHAEQTSEALAAANTNTNSATQATTINKPPVKLMPARKCVVRDCDGQGFGVYATEKIAAKELIEECHLMPPITPDVFNSCSTTFPINSFIYRGPKGQTAHVVALGFAGTYRHSSNDYNAIWVQHETAKALQFHALRDIEPGEEIRINFAMGKSGVKELIPPTKVEVRESTGMVWF